MSSSITSETRWQKPCQEDLKRITTRPQSMSPATVSMPGLPSMPYTEQLPSRLKDREGATLVLLSTICLQEGLGGVCQRKHRPPRHLKEPRSGPLNHCRSFYLCDWSASFSRSSQHTGRACPNVLLSESGTQYKANTETLTAAAAMGFPPQTLIITHLDDFWLKQTQQRLGLLLSLGFLTAVM